MKRKTGFIGMVLALALVLSTRCSSAQGQGPCKAGGQTCYFGVEINGVLSGYSKETYCTGVFEGRDVRYEHSLVTVRQSMLGTNIDGGFEVLSVIDRLTDKPVRIELDVINGQTIMEFNSYISGDTIYFDSPTSGIKKSVPAGREVILSSMTRYPWLLEDFVIKGVPAMRYRVYDPLRGAVMEKDYSVTGEEDIIVNDSVYHCVVIEEKECQTGLMTKLWISRNDGFNVRTEAGSRIIYLADESVKGRITYANLESEFFISVDSIIDVLQNVKRLRVRAEINSYGEHISSESLNSPGQKFEGKVDGSHIEGVFEIEPVRYHGKNAPPFPPSFSDVGIVKKYLVSETMIESDDPLIQTEAARITSGSKDSWDAVIRLSRWVSENIAGALPGGVSAINTLKTREAECGGHSRLLAAFCRASGIPARLAMGCMYLNYNKGAFGQHAWTEVFMGEAGWIPVDATISECDYIDAGHIRLGENSNFRPVSMKIIDFTSSGSSERAAGNGDLSGITGSYMNVDQYKRFNIINTDGGLALEIPGRMALILEPPDARGMIFPKLTRQISLEPRRESNGEVNELLVREYTRFMKISGPDTAGRDNSSEFRKYGGIYRLPDRRMTLDVAFSGNTMTTQDMSDIGGARVNYLEQGEKWIGDKEGYEIEFIKEGGDKVTGFVLASGLLFRRGEPVNFAIEPVIRESGVKAGLKTYDAIKKSGTGKYFFSVNMLHDLGHKLLKENRVDDAIAVFFKNVKEYPGSFMAVDALAETCLANGEEKMALRYFREAVKLNPEYEYGREMIEKIHNR